MRTQLILFGLDLFGRQRRRIDQLLPGQPHRALMNGREEQQHQQASGEEPNAAQHQRLDHPPCFPEKRC
ncbi:MAG: hypothetical protein ACLQFW_23720 [Xanthobacteraceae bacterium]